MNWVYWVVIVAAIIAVVYFAKDCVERQDDEDYWDSQPGGRP